MNEYYCAFYNKFKPKMAIGYGEWKCFKKIKGEKKLLKIIVKNKETGYQKCIDIPKERENGTDIKCLKVGMTVYYLEKMGMQPELVEIVKIVDDRPKGAVFSEYVPPLTWNPWRFAGRRAGRATGMKGFIEDVVKKREEIKERSEYQKKPYFNVRLDPIKGRNDGIENLKKMKFPCWIVYKMGKDFKHKIAMLVTGCPGLTSAVEYQLIDMMEQVPIGEVCTMWRDTDLGKLMERLYSWEVVKGESQLWKIGKFNI